MSAETVDPARRRLMQRVKQKNTEPELAVRRALFARGWRYRLHRRDLPGRPDIVFGSRRVAVFVHGCFWHGHDCRLGREPKTRKAFWAEKLAGNRARDERQQRRLVDLGWQVVVIWGCELADLEQVVHRIEASLDASPRRPVRV